MYYTTLNKIRAHGPCEESWKTLLASLSKTSADDEPVSLLYILDIIGIEDALWALRAVDGIERECRLFACRRAESVLYIYEREYPNDPRPRRAIEVARAYAEGTASESERAVAWAAVRDVVRAASWAAVRDAVRAVAWAAAWAAARDAAGAAVRAAAWAAAGNVAWYAAEDDFIKTFCNPKSPQPCS
jgi:hypothetical protein